MYIFRKYVKVIFKYSSLLFQNGITLFIYPLLFKPLLLPHLPPPHPQLPIRKNEQKIYLKTIESAKTGLITRSLSVWTSSVYGSLNDFK